MLSSCHITAAPISTRGGSIRASALLSALMIVAASAAVESLRRKRRQARQASLATALVGRGSRVILAVDIGSSSVRCSAYAVGSPPALLPGCAFRVKHSVVKGAGTADAEEVIDLVDTVVDRCLR